MAELPGGMVTFLFTDIEGSTRLLHSLGQSYGDVLADHRRLLREAFSSSGGIEVDTQGDAFFVVFTTPQAAVNAAIEAQQKLSKHPWAEGSDLRVRMGIHTVVALLDREDTHTEQRCRGGDRRLTRWTKSTQES